MISNAIFPCIFTDGARILGELSYTLGRPVYTDMMIMQDLADGLGTTTEILIKKLFFTSCCTNKQAKEKEMLIAYTRCKLEALINEDDDRIYYGFFTSLLESNNSTVNKILIMADDECRLQRGISQEGLTKEKARAVMVEHDRQAADWTQFLFATHPHNPDLYTTVIRYECQDLLDVIAYVFMLHEDRGSTAYATAAC